jgi:tetratricopeptide (TPR) repeat protein
MRACVGRSGTPPRRGELKIGRQFIADNLSPKLCVPEGRPKIRRPSGALSFFGAIPAFHAGLFSLAPPGHKGRFGRLRRLVPGLALGWLIVQPAWGADPKALNTALERANDALSRGKLAEAEKLVDSAARLAPDKPEVANLRGALFSRQGKFEEADRQFHRALEIDPNFQLARFNLAELSLLRNQVDEAKTRFEELQKIDPESELLQFKVVICDVLKDQENQAVMGTEQINFPGRTPAYYFARAAILLRKNQTKEADQYLANARKYYTQAQCAYFDQALREVKLLTSATPEKGKK